MAVNMVLDSKTSRSVVAFLDRKKNTSYLQEVPANLSHIAFVGNLLVSEGKPGKVLKIHVKKRTGDKDNLADYMQKALANHYTNQLVSKLKLLLYRKKSISSRLPVMKLYTLHKKNYSNLWR